MVVIREPSAEITRLRTSVSSWCGQLADAKIVAPSVQYVGAGRCLHSYRRLQLVSLRSVLDFKMLRPDANQVAGHRFEEGKVGSLVDDQGRFYKPMQGQDRGDSELEFYQKFWGDETVPELAKKFFPRFYGTTVVDASDGSGQIRHAILDNLTQGYRKPSVVDVKVGYRTWYTGARESYIQKCLEKDRNSTSSSLGFRIAGMQAYDAEQDKQWKPERKWSKKLTAEEVPVAFTRFASTNPLDGTDFNGGLISSVYGGHQGILSQLADLISWFEVQTSYHFYSCSVLFVYEGDTKSDAKENMPPSVKMIDFPHVIDGQGRIDENFIQGLKSLHNTLSKLVEKPE